VAPAQGLSMDRQRRHRRPHVSRVASSRRRGPEIEVVRDRQERAVRTQGLPVEAEARRQFYGTHTGLLLNSQLTCPNEDNAFHKWETPPYSLNCDAQTSQRDINTMTACKGCDYLNQITEVANYEHTLAT